VGRIYNRKISQDQSDKYKLVTPFKNGINPHLACKIQIRDSNQLLNSEEQTMKIHLWAAILSINLIISPCVMADSYNDVGLNNDGSTDPSGMNERGDNNALVQGFDGTGGLNSGNNNDTQDDIAVSASSAGISRDGETMGDED
jgi:hypothetical protein